MTGVPDEPPAVRQPEPDEDLYGWDRTFGDYIRAYDALRANPDMSLSEWARLVTAREEARHKLEAGRDGPEAEM